MDERIRQDYTIYYDNIEVIGYGAYGIVYKAKLKNNKNDNKSYGFR